jgi:hypothetical protein
LVRISRFGFLIAVIDCPRFTGSQQFERREVMGGILLSDSKNPQHELAYWEDDFEMPNNLFISSMSGVLRVVTWIVITNWDRRESTWSFSTDVLKPSLNRTLGRVVRYVQLELPQLNA